MLPLDVVYYIRDHLLWRYRCITVSKEWLRGALRLRVRNHRWRTKRRLYCYMKLFGPEFVGYTWQSFCLKVLGVHRRRLTVGRVPFSTHLSWRAAAARRVDYCHCVGCGVKTTANVMGVSLCCRCRCNRRLINCYMVKVYQAKSLGISKDILNRVPYHKGIGCHLRFWRDIQATLDKLSGQRPAPSP